MSGRVTYARRASGLPSRQQRVLSESVLDLSDVRARLRSTNFATDAGELTWAP
jgi:hypothetical protein